MPIFKLDKSGCFHPFAPTPFPDLERQLEDWIEANPHMLLDGEALVVIARQPRTSFDKALDLLAIDRTGATVVIELKRGQAPREVVAQAVEYAAWVDSLSKIELDKIARTYTMSKGKDTGLEELYESVFGEAVGKDGEEGDENEEDGDEVETRSSAITFNNRQRLVILAEEFSPELEQSLRYLRIRHRMDVTAIKFTVHKAGEDVLVNTIPIVGREHPSTPAMPRPAGMRNEAYRRFFERLRDRLDEQGGFSRWSFGRSWMNADAGIPGVRHNGVRYDPSFASGGRARVGLYIDLGPASENKSFFDAAHGRQEQIEKAFGEPLTWQRLDDRRACRIAVYREGRIHGDEEGLQAIADWMVDSLGKFKDRVVPSLTSG